MLECLELQLLQSCVDNSIEVIITWIYIDNLLLLQMEDIDSHVLVIEEEA